MKRLGWIFLCVLISFSTIAQKKAPKSIEPAAINLENITYPFPVKFVNASVQWQQLRMAYMDVQPEKPNGKNILLLHGKNFNGSYWETTAKDLQKQGYRVIIPDQVGFGKSTKPRHFQYSFQLMAMQTKSLLDSLGIGTGLFGWRLSQTRALRYCENDQQARDR